MHELQTNNDSLLFDREPTPTKSLAERVAEDAASPELQADRDPDLDKAIGITMFDVPGSEDQTLTVLLPQQNIQYAASQSLLRIKSKGDDRVYLGIVVAGPFAEPDSLRGDSNMLVTVATRKVDYRPPYHGRVQVSLLGEQLKDGTLCPHRWRPLPNSPVFALSDAEAQSVFKAAGDLRLGLVVGYDKVVVGIPSREKSVLPRHTAILGTTGGGKSTTVAGLVQQAQAADMSVILLDVEGEYTRLHEKTTNPGMLTALEARKLAAEGLPPDKMSVHCLVGRAPANPDHPNPKVFSLQFARLSPYAAAEILGLSEPQQVRFMKANDIAKEVLRDLNIFPRKGNKDDERMAMEIDEFEGGYPNLTLSIFIDVVTACLKVVEAPKSTRKGSEDEVHVEFTPYNKRLGAPDGIAALKARIRAAGRLDSAVSWGALLARLWRLHRLNVFDVQAQDVEPMKYKELLRPGTVSVIDLSDSGMSELNNIVLSDLLRGVQDEQDNAYQQYEASKKHGSPSATPSRTLIIIEEAHEFISAERIEKMNILFEQIAQIAKRGRKRWLSLVFVTQLPQHLPREILGLVNSFILHKITDPQVTSTLRKIVGGIDEDMWNRVSALAPGQAIVSFPHMTRPLLVAIDPTRSELRLVD